MKNLIKKTIVMVLLVCIFVSTVGVQPVQAHIKLPDLKIPLRPNEFKSLKNKKPTAKGVYSNQDMLVVIIDPTTDYGVHKSVLLQVEKKVKGKYKYYEQFYDGILDNQRFYSIAYTTDLGLKPDDNIRVRLLYSGYDKKGKYFKTKWSKWYNIKIKKNKTINKNIKCNISKNKRGILTYQADKCDGYVIEFCKNKKFKEKDTEKVVEIFGVSMKDKDAEYGIGSYDALAHLHRGKYARVTPIELFSDGQIKYYPRSKTIKL